MGAPNPNRVTVKQLASLLSCRHGDVHATADRLGIPFDLRYGVDQHGDPIARRVYLRAAVDAALDEIGRQKVRGAA